MASGLKSLLFFLHSTAVMMMMTTVTTAMGASTAAMIQRLFGGFLTTAGTEKDNRAEQNFLMADKRCWCWGTRVVSFLHVCLEMEVQRPLSPRLHSLPHLLLFPGSWARVAGPG